LPPIQTKLLPSSRDFKQAVTLLWNLVSNTAGSLYNINAGFTAFSLDGSLWVAGGSGSFVMQDLTRQGSLAKLFTHPDFLSETAALSPNGKTIAYFDGNNKIVFWDVSGKKTRAQQPIGQTISIDSLAFSPDGTLLAAAHSDGTISLWGTGISDSPSLLGTLSGHTASVKSVAFSPDGKILASGSADRTVILWDLSTKRQIGQPLIGHSDIVNCVSFSPNGKTLASGSDDTNIILWDVQFHQPSIQIWTGFSEPVDNIAFPPDSKAVAISRISGSIEYRDILNGSHISNASDKQANSPTTVMSNPDWTTLVSQDILDWNDIVGVTHTFDPGGEKLALGTCGKFDAYNSCTEGMIILWDVSTSKRVNPPITGHTSQITSLSFSPDAKTLASGGGDTIILWDLDIRQPIGLPIRVPPGTIDHLTFSPDGNILAASIQAYDYNKGSNIVTIILWDLNPVSWIQQSCLRAGRNFTPKEWAQYFPEELYPKTQNEATCPQWRLEPEETLQIPITK
jgi:WD40 repeat protein